MKMLHRNGTERCRPRILILSHLYPRPGSPAAGIFVQRYADALAGFADVAVVSIARREAGTPVSSGLTVQRNGGVWVVLGERAVPDATGRIGGYRWVLSATVGAVLAELNGVKLAVGLLGGRPTLVNPHFAYPSSMTALALRMLGWRYIVTEHSTEYRSGRFETRGRFARSLIKLALRRAMVVTVVSEQLAHDMAAWGLKFRWVVVPNVVPESRPVGRPIGGPHRILSVSLMVDETKNVSGLLRAVAILRTKRQDFQLELIGDGKDRRSLYELSDDLGIRDVVLFRGLMNNEGVRGAMGRCAFVVTNSNVETFSVVTAEALMSGRPVVATRSGGPESFIGAETGLLIDPGDDLQLVEALDYMLDHYAEYDSELLHQYAMSRFSPDAVMRAYMQVMNGEDEVPRSVVDECGDESRVDL